MYEHAGLSPRYAAGNIWLLLPIGLMAGSTPVSAETLQEAMASAYRYNPVMEAGRSSVRAVDENVAIANSGYRPKIAAIGTATWEDTKVSGGEGGVVVGPSGNLTQGGINKSGTYGVGISQPLFTGLQVTNQVRSAEAGVRAARELLRDTERSVLMQAVTAYVGVLTSQESVRAYEQNLSRLDKEVRVAEERVALTQLTNTDLAQAKYRRADAVSSLATAQAELRSNLAAYLSTVGHEASGLVFPRVPAGLPKSLAEAQGIALNENPLIVSSLYNEESARYAVDQIRGQLLPQISLDASWDDEYNSTGVEFTRSAEVSANVTVPIYEGGQVHAQVRQAKQIHVGQLQLIEAARSTALQAVATAWSNLEAARARVALASARMQAADVALTGVRQEETIGQRTLLDVLNAEQDILDARLQSIVAKRDEVVGAYEVLSQIGHLSAEQIGLATLIYDPTVHYEEVRRKWFGLDITDADGAREHVVVEETSVK